MILSASGGLVYHARAAFTRIESLLNTTDVGDRWSPTRRCVSTLVSGWLGRVQPERLIIFGPSAGYLLEQDFFRSHDRKIRGGLHADTPIDLIVVDPDPIAKVIFRRRFSKSPIRWHQKSNLLPFFSREPETFAAFLRAPNPATGLQPRIAVLFLGVLGQMPLHKDKMTRPMSEAIRIFHDTLLGDDGLRGRDGLKDREPLSFIPWASLHDLESCELQNPINRLPPELIEISDATPVKNPDLFSRELRLEAVAKILKENPTWIDHETSWIGDNRALIPWLLTPSRFHLLGFTSS